MAQDGPKMAQDGPKMATRWPKKRTCVFATCFCYFTALRLKMPHMAPRWPKMAPDGPRKAQGDPKMAPRWPQGGPKMAHKTIKHTRANWLICLIQCILIPGWPQDSPKRPQDGPKWAQEVPSWGLTPIGPRKGIVGESKGRAKVSKFGRLWPLGRLARAVLF